jgi:hypothetical protein
VHRHALGRVVVLEKSIVKVIFGGVVLPDNVAVIILASEIEVLKRYTRFAHLITGSWDGGDVGTEVPHVVIARLDLRGAGDITIEDRV